MAEKGKGKKTPAKDEAGVMAGLSTTRPPRIGGRRRGTGTGRPAPAGTPASQGDGAGPAGAVKRASTSTASTASKSAAKPAATSAAKPAAKSAPKAAAKSAAKPAAKAAAKPAARKPSEPAGMPSAGAVEEVHETPTRKPRPVRAGSPALKRATAEAAKKERPAARTAPPPPSAPDAPSGTELVTTAIQAAGELAQIGVTVGGQILKRALDRLPKP